MNAYYYLVAGLPELSQKAMDIDLTFAAFLDEIGGRLAPSDRAYFDGLLYRNDNDNLLQLLDRQRDGADTIRLEPAAPATLDEEALDLLLRDPGAVAEAPDYLRRFVTEESARFRKEERYQLEDRLTAYYYGAMISSDNPFMAAYFRFELDLQNTITAINCRRFELNADTHLVGQNDVTEALTKSSLNDFGLGLSHPWVADLLTLFDKAEPVALELGIDRIKWQQIDEINALTYFTVDVILGFAIKLLTIERWMRLDPESGLARYRQMVDGMLHSFEFPDIYTIKHGRR